MRLSLYFPCCISRKLEYLYLQYKRSKRKNIVHGIFFTVLFFVILYVNIGFNLLLAHLGFICSSEIIYAKIAEMCHSVERNIFSQPFFNFTAKKPDVSITQRFLCNSLCRDEKFSGIASCHTFHVSKSIVFGLEVSSLFHVIVKSVSEPDFVGQVDDRYFMSAVEDFQFPTLQEFVNMVKGIVSLTAASSDVNKGFQMILDTANELYDKTYQTSEKENLQILHKNYWKFVEDQEFLLSLLLQETNLFPFVYDTCGDLYAAEFVETLPENIIIPFEMSKNERLLKALDIVKYVEHLDTLWNVPLHLCDVRMSHFGWTSSGHVKFVDLDSVMPENLLLDTIRNVPFCKTDDDCSFFDCAAKCNLSIGKCAPDRTNSNLQVICQKIFLGKGISFSYYGLLTDLEENEFDSEDVERVTPIADALQLCQTNPGMTTSVLIQVFQQAYRTQAS